MFLESNTADCFTTQIHANQHRQKNQAFSLSCTYIQFMNAQSLSLIFDYRMVLSFHTHMYTNLPRINLKAIVYEQKSLLFASAVSIY